MARQPIAMPDIESVASIHFPEDGVLRTSCAVEWFRDDHSVEVILCRELNRFFRWRETIRVDDPQTQPRGKSSPTTIRIFEGRGNSLVTVSAVREQQIVVR